MVQLGNIRRFRITARPVARFHIPAFGGSMIRGALGHALRHSYCRCEESESAVLHRADCLYASLFEAGAGHAFVITPPLESIVAVGQSFECFVTLLKNDSKHTEAFLDSLDLAFRRGLGPEMIPCHVNEIQSVVPEIMPLERSVRLELLTPWFIKYRGKALRANELTVHSFLIAVAQRQRLLIKEGLLDATIPENQQLLALADTLLSKIQVRDVQGARRSNRQNNKHPLNGIIGSMELHSDKPQGLRNLTAMLYRSQWLHGGGKVSFGLGALDVRPVSQIESQLGELERMATGEAV
jgi:hypothetical protein